MMFFSVLSLVCNFMITHIITVNVVIPKSVSMVSVASQAQGGADVGGGAGGGGDPSQQQQQQQQTKSMSPVLSYF